MARIAIAGGTGGVGQTFVKAFSKTPHQVIVLSRTEKESDFPNIKYVKADYDSIPALAQVLEEYKIDTVLSALNMSTPATSTSQLNLVAASQASSSTHRFIPSEYGVLANAETLPLDPYVKYLAENAEALEKTDLQYTRIATGWLMDYWGMPRIESEMARFRWAVDIENALAIIPGTGDEKFSMTYSYDLAKLIIRLLDEPEWPRMTALVGQDVTFNQLVSWAEDATGRKFDVKYDSLENLVRGESTAFPEGETMQLPNELVVMFGRLLVEGHVLLPKEGGFRLNERFPELNILTVERMVRENWA